MLAACTVSLDRAKRGKEITMQFGMPTLIEIKSLESCVSLCRELGLAFVELNMNMQEYQAHRLDLERLRRIADDNGIYYTIHLDENLNPCDFNERVASAYTNTVLHIIETAKQLAMPVLVMHMNSGVRVTLPDEKVFLFSEYESDYLRKLTAFRDACEIAIGESDIKICVENCGDFGDRPFIRNGLELLLESPVFALTFDIGHNAGADYVDEPFIMEHADRLAHFHIHDARGHNNHLALGEGDVDMGRYLDLAEMRSINSSTGCRAVVEVKTVDGLRRSVSFLKDRRLI